MLNNIDKENKKIKIEIPLTKPTGKVRIKQRNIFTDFGVPVATKQKKLTQKCTLSCK